MYDFYFTRWLAYVSALGLRIGPNIYGLSAAQLRLSAPKR